MSPLLNKLLSIRKIEYLVVDRDFHICKTSLGVQRLADSPNEVMKGNDVRLGFPELIGMEDILFAIIQGQQDSFELKGIGRFGSQSPALYVDLLIISSQDKENLENQLVLFFEDVTERMIMEQKLVQKSNETSLLLEAWAYSSTYLDKIIKSISEFLLVTTPSGTIKLVNKAIKDALEYSEEELIGQPISVIFGKNNTLSEVSPVNLLAGKFCKNVEVVCQTKTGEKVMIAFSRSTVETDIEDLQDFIYIGREIGDC